MTGIIIISIFIIGEILVRILVTAQKEPYYRFDAKNKLFRRKPRSDGKFVKRNVNGYYLLNNEGWNSTRDYFKEKDSDTYRIACIGSSETGAYEVHVKDTYPKVIEDTLLQKGLKVEVYTFAEDRAIGLGHALHLTRYAIRNYQPDIILYNGHFGGELLSDNTTKTHYMLIKVDAKGNAREIPPRNESLPVLGKEYAPQSLLFHSKLIKFLRPIIAIRTRFNKTIKNVRKLGQKNKKNNLPHRNSSAVKNRLSESEKNEIAIKYILEQFKKIQEEQSTRLLYVIKPVRDRSFNWNDISNGKETKIRETEIKKRIDILNEYSIPYYELGNVFTEDFKINKRKFDFLLNPHLNEHGHKVEGESIAKFLIENNYFDDRLSKQNLSKSKETKLSA